MTIHPQTFENARRILTAHYSDVLNGRPMTDDEVQAEIDSLIRKNTRGSLDYVGEALYAAIDLGSIK